MKLKKIKIKRPIQRKMIIIEKQPRFLADLA
jgi:hypothetical protein